MYKVCTKCGELKEETEFYPRTNRPSREYLCKECKKAYLREWHRKKRDRNGAKRRDGRLPRAKQEFFVKYLKEHSCVDCGEKDPVVLEFDHVRGKKSATIAKLRSQPFSIERLKMEMEKCDIVCANCHRKRTYGRMKSWRNGLTSSAG